MKLIIDKKFWLHGEGADHSYLLRESDKKMCCIGFYCRALGIPDELITGVLAPHDSYKLMEAVANKGGSWLFAGANRASEHAFDLYQINDVNKNGQHISNKYDGLKCAATDPQAESKREEYIASIFAKHDVEVEFIDG